MTLQNLILASLTAPLLPRRHGIVGHILEVIADHFHPIAIDDHDAAPRWLIASFIRAAWRSHDRCARHRNARH